MKTKTKYTIRELAELCGYTVDALYKGKRTRCSERMAVKLEQVTGIKRGQWMWPTMFKNNPWQRVLRGAK